MASRKMTPALQRLSALVGSLDLTNAAGSVALTMISGVGRGEFRSPVRYLGSVCYMAIEVSPVTCLPVIRGYTAGVRNFAHEILIGSHQFNTMAHDPTGRSKLRFPESDAVAMAASRTLQYMASGQGLVNEDDVLLPELLAQVDTDVLSKGVNSNKLRQLGKHVRQQGTNWAGFCTPVSGHVIELRATDNEEHIVAVVQTEDEKLYEVRLPKKAKFVFSAKAESDATPVRAGQSLIEHLHNVSDFVLEDFAWRSLRREVTLPNGSVAEVVPFEYVSEAIRQKRVEPIAIYEDMENLLGPALENPAAIVRAGIELPEMIHEASPEVQSMALSRFRRELGDQSCFASDEDLLSALQYPTQPLHVTGMAHIQHWKITNERSMLLKRPDCSADFQGMRAAWRRLLRNPDLEPVLQQVIEQADAATTGGDYGEAALSILRQYPTLCGRTISRVQALVDEQADDERVRSYLTDAHARVHGPMAEATAEETADERDTATVS